MPPGAQRGAQGSQALQEVRRLFLRQRPYGLPEESPVRLLPLGAQARARLGQEEANQPLVPGVGLLAEETLALQLLGQDGHVALGHAEPAAEFVHRDPRAGGHVADYRGPARGVGEPLLLQVPDHPLPDEPVDFPEEVDDLLGVSGHDSPPFE